MSTIQIGIDLGTTNSAIAYNNCGNIEIIKNFEMDEFTPSVFGYDKANNPLVGKRAYEKLFKYADKGDIQNFKAEVKRLMGTPEITFFPRVDKNMKAEEISAELLKYLKSTVLKKYPEVNTIGAVITIPAHFSTLESEATKRSGELAGFKQVVLLQEPIAAAIAYGFGKEQNTNWLVYDLGGGTFDTALIQSKDGLLNILSSKGDNFLGGKDFDWAIVDNIFIPKITEKFSLLNFSRGNEKYKNVFNILKGLAENTKKMLTYDNEVNVEIDKVGEDDNGNEIYLNITITKKDFEKLVEPFVKKSLVLVKETINESGVDKNSIEKIVLVGGSTQSPIIKDRLEKEFGIEVDSSVDPLTVVSKGGAIYASNQIIKDEFKENNKVCLDSYNIKLNYEAVSSENEEMVSGIIEGLNEDEEFFIQIQSESGYYSSNKILIKNGKFIANIKLEAGKTNNYMIYLIDSKGNTLELNNDSFTISQGLSVGSIPIPYNIGVSIAKQNNGLSWKDEMYWFFEKNSKLPLSKTIEFKTSKSLIKGESTNALPIKVYEGESENPDRNQFICDLGISGEKIPYDLEAGTPVEVTIEVDTSRQLSVKAYISSIDLSLNVRTTTLNEEIDLGLLKKDLDGEQERYAKIRASFTPTQKEEIDEEISYLEGTVNNANNDEDEKRKANKKLKDFKVKIDNLEKNTEFDIQEKLFNELTEILDGVIDEMEKTNDYKAQELVVRYKTVKNGGKKAIDTQDKILLSSINEQLDGLRTSILMETIEWWERMYNDLKFGGYNFNSEDDADYYFKKGENALKNNNKDELATVVRELFKLLPKDELGRIEGGNLSGITLY
ncbi:Hsp70 family protein [Candidatus Vampirococcus lugosii]|uniref:Molecular chaperone DnaK (HSP70) n=1 Tax=Candidatus Vampirococcus lugosii TaxID=2789015 RepID=A0ABS5QM02_9BACT|nr:Hsp70 family protein [Candidatus Vampirococcus lugosii]MBS8122197.1 Molecular chaperone DnaK (HSP70) [Candidatus Vampirococcus lugosii]